MKKLIKPFLGLLFLIVVASCFYGQMLAGKDTLLMQYDETACDKVTETGNFHSYTVMLEGQILDYADFKLKRYGKLSLVTGNLDSGNPTGVPFYIYLKR